tara:strand:+ start:210 stop:536 length:327 start_codon:yes stop_codon:yes gene_type:complete
MPNTLTVQTSDEHQPQESVQEPDQNLALRNFYRIIKDNVTDHSDNPQLLLLIGIELNELSIVQEVIANYDVNPTQNITGRNHHIMEQFVTNYGVHLENNSPRSIVVND